MIVKMKKSPSALKVFFVNLYHDIYLPWREQRYRVRLKKRLGMAKDETFR